MAELARMRGDKQIWLTRGHMAALATTTLFIAVLSFFIGLQLGQQRAGAPAPAASPQLLPDPAKEDALEALLRQVETARADGGTAQELTFPQALTSGEAPETPTAPLSATDRASAVSPPADLVAPSAGSSPSLPMQDGWVILVYSMMNPDEAATATATLSEAGWTASQATALVQGANQYRVYVGGYPSQEEATEAAGELATSLGTNNLQIMRAP